MKQLSRGRAANNFSGYSGLNQLLILLCLTGFTVTEPILTIFGANPSIFYFYNIDSASLTLLYAVTVAFGPALVLWFIIFLARCVSDCAALAVQYLIFGLLVGLWCIQLAKWGFGVDSSVLLVLFFMLGCGAFLWAHARLSWFNTWLKIAAIAPLVTVGVFVFSSDSGSFGSRTAVAASQSNTHKNLPSVLFVMLDEFPTVALFDKEGSIDKVRFPNIAALSDQATWYRHYTVLAGQTVHSVPAILSGTDPKSVPPNLANYPNNLFTLLAPSHHLTIFESLTRLCGLVQCSEDSPGAPIMRAAPQWSLLWSKTVALWLQRISLVDSAEPGLDDFQEMMAAKPARTKSRSIDIDDLFDPSNQSKYAQAKPERLQKFISTMVASEKPTLYFLHLEMPHIPWRFYETGQLYGLPYTRTPFAAKNDDGGEWLARLSEYRFMIQAQYTDELLGNVIARLKSLGAWDDMLVVVTADHGRSFRLNTDSRKLQPETYSSVAYAPLLLKRPNQKIGEIDDSNLMAYDILPTVADVLGIEIPWDTVGFAAGDERISQRADDKICFPKKSQFKLLADLGRKRVFSDREHFPAYSSRRIGALQFAQDPFSQLNASLGLDEYFRRSPNDYEVTKGGRATVDELDLLEQPSGDRPPLGVVMGSLQFDPVGAMVLVAINGRFVSGSPLVEFKKVKNTFIAMLPRDALSSHNIIEVYLVEEYGLKKLELE
jgi:hypothetical protein